MDSLVFARAINKEVLTKPRVLGAVVIMVGGSLIASAAPADACNEFKVEDIRALAMHPGGAAFALIIIGTVFALSAVVVWYERSYGMPTDVEDEERMFRERQSMVGVLSEGHGSVVFATTPAEMRSSKASSRTKGSSRKKGAHIAGLVNALCTTPVNTLCYPPLGAAFA